MGDIRTPGLTGQQVMDSILCLAFAVNSIENHPKGAKTEKTG
jgi:hypothetical protein